jgi:hypothetical protein
VVVGVVHILAAVGEQVDIGHQPELLVVVRLLKLHYRLL